MKIPAIARKFIANLRTSLAAFVAVGLICTLTAGCTVAQKLDVKTVVSQVGSDITKALPLVNSAASVAELLLPGDALIISGVTSTVDAGLVELSALCNVYAMSPSDSVWQSIQAVVTKLVNSGAAGILDAAKITDPASRAKATAVLGALQTVLLIIDGVVQQAQTTSQVKQSAALRTFKLEQIKPYLNQELVERETGHDFQVVYGYETQLGF